MNVYAYKYMYVWVCVCICMCCVLAFSGPDKHCESEQLWSPWLSPRGGGRPSHLMRSAGGLSPWDWRVEWDSLSLSCLWVTHASVGHPMNSLTHHGLGWNPSFGPYLLRVPFHLPSKSHMALCVCVCVRTRRTHLWQVVCIIRRPAAWWELRSVPFSLEYPLSLLPFPDSPCSTLFPRKNYRGQKYT